MKGCRGAGVKLSPCHPLTRSPVHLIIHMDPIRLIVIFVAAIVAGAVNSIAGGGTVFSFTALAWAGLPLINANATNATALVPGSLGGAIALRRELIPQWRSLVILLIPTITGSLLGAFTVANTSETIFRSVVPFLVLFATLVFAGRNRIMRLAKRTAGVNDHITPRGFAVGHRVLLCAACDVGLAETHRDRCERI